jgi:hypothetical protein
VELRKSVVATPRSSDRYERVMAASCRVSGYNLPKVPSIGHDRVFSSPRIRVPGGTPTRFHGDLMVSS